MVRAVFLSPETYIQASLMADAAAETLRLTRLVDREDFALEHLSYEVGKYVKHIRCLFEHGEAFRVDGFSKHAVTYLSTAKILRTRRGTIKIFGGPRCFDESVQRRCLQRMAAWTQADWT